VSHISGAALAKMVLKRHTKSLAEAHAHRIKRITQFLEGNASLSGSMPHASTIEMHFDADTVSVVGNTYNLVLGEYCTLYSIFQRDNFSRCTVEPVE
jgi:hypothetical protein